MADLAEIDAEIARKEKELSETQSKLFVYKPVPRCAQYLGSI